MHRVRQTLLIALTALMVSCGPPPSKDTKATGISLQWKRLGQLPGDSLPGSYHPNPGLAGPVTGICGDYLIVGGGANFPDGLPWEGGAKRYYDQIYLYQLHQEPDSALLLSTSARLPCELAYPACVSTGRGIIVAGGENDKGPTGKVLLITIDPGSGSPVIRDLPALPEATSGGMITAMEDRVYFAGGNTATGTSRQLLVLDLSDPQPDWKRLTALPQATAYGVLYSRPQTGELYLAGGRRTVPHKRTVFYSTLFAFNTAHDVWHKKNNLPYAVAAATGIRLQDKLLLFGGDRGATFHQTEDLLIKIAGAKDNRQRQAFIEQKNKIQKQHPGFTPRILCYDLAGDRWEPAGHLDFQPQVTTTAALWGNIVIIPSGEVRAGVRTPDIIGGYGVFDPSYR